MDFMQDNYIYENKKRNETFRHLLENKINDLVLNKWTCLDQYWSIIKKHINIEQN